MPDDYMPAGYREPHEYTAGDEAAMAGITTNRDAYAVAFNAFIEAVKLIPGKGWCAEGGAERIIETLHYVLEPATDADIEDWYVEEKQP